MNLFSIIPLYFDPGLGAMVIQSLIAAVAAFFLFSKTILFKIKTFLGLKKDTDDDYDDINIKEETPDNESK